MKEYKLENWSVVADPYQAPEIRTLHLSGDRTPENGLHNPVTTTRVVEVSGRTVKTRSGSMYILGEPDKEYLTWLDQNKIAFDPENPIKVHGSTKTGG